MQHLTKRTLNTVIKEKISNAVKLRIVKGILHPYLKISMFVVLSKNYQHFFFKK